MKANVYYATQKGSTREIASYILDLMIKLGVHSEAINVADTSEIKRGLDALILINPIYKGMWLPEMTRFVRKNTEAIADTPIWALFPCIRVIEAGGEDYAKNNYVPDHLLSHLNVREIRFIAGKMLKSDMTREDMLILSARYDGEQVNNISGDYRDWQGLNKWTYQVVLQLQELRGLS